MKWPGYILSVYLIFLAVIPCCAFDDCPDDKTMTEQSPDHKSGDNDDCGTCSPFFNCEGCASVTINAEPINVTLITFLLPRVYNHFICSVVPTVHYDFWQPPKLG